MFGEVAVFAQPVEGPAADAADFLVGAGEVEPGADVPTAARVEERDGVGGAGQPAQHPPGLLAVGVSVAGVTPRRPAAFRRLGVVTEAGLLDDLLLAGRPAGAGHLSDRGRSMAGEDPPPAGCGTAGCALFAERVGHDGFGERPGSGDGGGKTGREMARVHVRSPPRAT